MMIALSFLPPGRSSGQRGVTLIIALIMLAVLGLLAVYAVRVGTANLLIVNNTQLRHEAFATAQTAIEATISTPAFITQTDLVVSTPVGVDLDGDGNTDMSASVAPACYRWRAVKQSELDPANASDLSCMVSGMNPGAIFDPANGATVGNSLCADSEWNLRAVVDDPAAGASVAVNQGIAVRGLITDLATSCQ